jgi:hypothetical protein
MEPSKSVYDTVPVADEHYESRSSTEVDESLIGDEHHWHSITLGSAELKKRSTCISAFQSYRSLIDTVLLFVILMLLVVLLLQSERNGAQSNLPQVGGDYKAASPIC